MITREQILALAGSNRFEDLFRASKIHGFTAEDVDREFKLAPGTSQARINQHNAPTPATLAPDVETFSPGSFDPDSDLFNGDFSGLDGLVSGGTDYPGMGEVIARDAVVTTGLNALPWEMAGPAGLAIRGLLMAANFLDKKTPSSNAGILTSRVPGVSEDRLVALDPYASGFQPYGFNRRSSNDAVSKVDGVFRTIDSTLFDIMKRAGIPVDYSKSNPFVGLDETGRGEGAFFGAAAEDGTDSVPMGQQAERFTRQWLSGIRDEIGDDAYQEIISAGSVPEIIAAAAEAVRLHQQNKQDKGIPPTISESSGYIRRTDMSDEQIQSGVDNGSLTVYTNPDGSKVVLDKEGFFQDYTPQTNPNEGGGGSAGGGGGQTSSPSGGGTMPGTDWVYPNERIVTPGATVLGTHTNPDGSTVTVFSDGAEMWEKPPESFEDWPEDPVNKPILERIIDLVGTGPLTVDDDLIIAEAMDRNGVTADQIASATGLSVDVVIDRYNRAKSSTRGNGSGTGAGNGSGSGSGTGAGNGSGSGNGSGGGPGSGGGSGNGDGTGEGSGNQPSVTLEQLLSPTRTTDSLFAPELRDFQRGLVLGNLFRT